MLAQEFGVDMPLSQHSRKTFEGEKKKITNSPLL